MFTQLSFGFEALSLIRALLRMNIKREDICMVYKALRGRFLRYQDNSACPVFVLLFRPLAVVQNFILALGKPNVSGKARNFSEKSESTLKKERTPTASVLEGLDQLLFTVSGDLRTFHPNADGGIASATENIRRFPSKLACSGANNVRQRK
ncbi:hypothetical protein PoB_001743200 [Plakobranchus ocellatus]|uniref:Uncharacterized protein n=1 Tax=Plakobranchus ocellatus TaxID=259542 RepID=A0AAV3Z8X6_9GAST|nr:hypothetical protein PoB_001743200 [Plakobranchus ocellatus]